MIPATLDDQVLGDAVDELASRDDDLRAIVARHGRPPLWSREPGFATLVRIILEQQISLSSAQAAYDRLEQVAGEVEPMALLELGGAGMRAVGQTRQKSRYLTALAEAITSGGLDLDALERADEEEVSAKLMAVLGIGRWSADIYLLMALRRPDVWPSGDIALAAAMRAVKGLPARPGPDRMVALAEAWRPWRAAAARLLWHAYLSGDRG